MKKIICIIVSCFMFVILLTPTSNVNAQSGEGLDVCTWYSSNGFSSISECQEWYKSQQEGYTPYWANKTSNCLIQEGITVGVSYAWGLLATPKIAFLTFGAGFIGCMFG